MDNICSCCKQNKKLKEKYIDLLEINDTLKLYIQKIEKELAEIKSLNYDSLDEYFK